MMCAGRPGVLIHVGIWRVVSTNEEDECTEGVLSAWGDYGLVPASLEAFPQAMMAEQTCYLPLLAPLFSYRENTLAYQVFLLDSCW